MAEAVNLKYQDLEMDLPVVIGSEGEVGIDVSKLRAQSKMITLDEGYVNTGSVASSITYLDGEQGNGRPDSVSDNVH